MDLDQIVKDVADIQAAVKSGGVIDKDALLAELGERVEGIVDARVQAKLDAQPQRRVAGADIGPDGTPIAKSNRYYAMLKGFASDGVYKSGIEKTKPADLWIAHNLISKGHALMPDRVNAPSADLSAAVKALTSTGSATGDEYVPTDLAASVWEDIFLASRVAGTLPPLAMPTNPFDIPLGLGTVTFRKGSENTATTHSDPSTGKTTMTATELVTEQRFSYTLDEDSLISLAPEIRRELARGGAEIIDDFALNADSTNAATGNINLDDADPDDTAYYLSDGQDGIRHLWIVDNTAQTVNAGGDALVDADFTGALVKMGKYAGNITEVVAVCDLSTYLNGFLTLTNVVTVDKFGPSAVVLTGELAKYRGVAIIPSAVHRLAEADGKLSTTSGSNTLGSISLYNRTQWRLGFRRNLLIEVDRDVQARQIIMVTSLRQAIGTRGTRSTSKAAAGIRNILV